MEIVLGPNPILTTPCKEFDFAEPVFDPIEFSRELVKTMRDNNGLGIAAPQVGVSYRIFAMRADPNKVFFNPVIVNYSDEEISLEEGCLSFFGLIVPIKRSSFVRVRYRQPNGDIFTEQFVGMSARVVQHEMDHLEGVLFYNKANRYHREQALSRWRKSKKLLKGSKSCYDEQEETEKECSGEQVL